MNAGSFLTSPSAKRSRGCSRATAAITGLLSGECEEGLFDLRTLLPASEDLDLGRREPRHDVAEHRIVEERDEEVIRAFRGRGGYSSIGCEQPLYLPFELSGRQAAVSELKHVVPRNGVLEQFVNAALEARATVVDQCHCGGETPDLVQPLRCPEHRGSAGGGPLD